MLRSTVVLMLMVLWSPQPSSAADVTAGQAAFNQCKICHTVDAGGRNTVGPNLHGIFGRKAGTGNFSYSEALKKSGIVWDDQALAKYLRNPKESVPSGSMAFAGITDDAKIAALLAYLHQATR